MRIRPIFHGLLLLLLWASHKHGAAQTPRPNTTTQPTQSDTEAIVTEWKAAWVKIEQNAKLMSTQNASNYRRRNRVELITRLTKKYRLTRKQLQEAIEKPKAVAIKDPKIEYLRVHAPEVIEKASLADLYRMRPMARTAKSREAAKSTLKNQVEDQKNPFETPRGALLINPDKSQEVIWWESLVNHHAMLLNDKVVLKRIKFRQPSQKTAEQLALEPTATLGKSQDFERTANPDAIISHLWEYQNFRLITSVIKSPTEEGESYFTEFLTADYKTIDTHVKTQVQPDPDSTKNP